MDKQRFVSRLRARIPARWHMSLICLLTFASGIVFSKMLLFFEMSLIPLRYSLAVLFSYGFFFLLVYLWLRWYFGARDGQSDDTDLDSLDLIAVPEGSGLSEAKWSGDGGKFSGGGASGTWGESKGELVKESTDIGDLDDAVIIILVVAVIAAVSGSALYIVYYAPEILFEAAFEAALVAGLFRKTKGIQSEGWAYSIFKRTWAPFTFALIAALTLGFAIKSQCPQASSYKEYRVLCR